MTRRRSTTSRRSLSSRAGRLALEFRPLSTEEWGHFEKLFGERGACGGCWCMWWRLRQREFESQKGEGNRRAMKRIVASGRIPGLLAFHRGMPVGWCSLAPREEFVRLEHSRILKPVDDRPVWSVVCFFVSKDYRRRGVSGRLLEAAVRYVKRRGGKIVEGYAVEPKKVRMPDLFAYHGLSCVFRDAGFKEVARRSPSRPIMRLSVGR
ncbi:MAG: GNAT family N-acetyltransferase [Candidatus Eiseniibacteriota bacterium]|nr:MAG: GNAT family N-acetyltransferase [Candidatus Eisenbacteria bacterium]